MSMPAMVGTKDTKDWHRLLNNLSTYIDSQIGEEGAHSTRVARWSTKTAYHLGFQKGQLKAIFWGAMLHDIGKIAIPPRVLGKSGPLNAEEWRLMKLHPAIGANIVTTIRHLNHIAPYIHMHQEMYDGSGYPKGLRGDEIPLGARILAVADAYEAMTSDRYYRKAPGIHYAIEELHQRSGTQFDPEVVETFLKFIPNGQNGHKRQNPV